jgi:hypothetical protein
MKADLLFRRKCLELKLQLAYESFRLDRMIRSHLHRIGTYTSLLLPSIFHYQHPDLMWQNCRRSKGNGGLRSTELTMHRWPTLSTVGTSMSLFWIRACRTSFHVSRWYISTGPDKQSRLYVDITRVRYMELCV